MRCRCCAPPPRAGAGDREPPRGAEPGHRDRYTKAGGEGGPGTGQACGSRGTVRGRGDQPAASSGLGEGVTEDAPPTRVADWCPGGTLPP